MAVDLADYCAQLMSTVFSKIINGDLPGRFVWADERAVGFLSINPLGPGHTLVVPRAEVDHWLDTEPDLYTHLMAVARTIGEAVQAVWSPPRVGLTIAGFEVPHLHIHVFPATGLASFDFATAAKSIDAVEQDGHRDALRAALRDAGHSAHVPS